MSTVPAQERPSMTERPMSDFHGGSGMVRPVSHSTVGSLQKNGAQRPSSEVLSAHYKSPEAEAIDRWFEDLSYYEQTLEQMARAKLDDNFREELKHIEQWFNVLSDPERTTALYSLLQHATQVQIRFFITVLQQMAQKDPAGGVPSPDQPGIPENVRITPGKVVSMPPRVSSPANAQGIVQISAQAAGDGHLVPLPDGRGMHRMYDRYSAPNAPEQYAQVIGDVQQRERGMDYGDYKRASYQSMRAASPAGSVRNSAPSPLLRPHTPVDDAIASADWSLNPTAPTVPVDRGNGALGNGTFSSPTLGLPHDDLSPSMVNLSLQPPRSPYARSASPRPVSPIILAPPNSQALAGHPSPGWGYVDVRSRTPSGYAHSDYSDSHSHDGDRDYRDGHRHHERTASGDRGVHKEKGKIPEEVDLEALNDIPGWLRSLRLHKYTPTFESMNWKDMIKLDDEALQAKGVSALGARRKMLKVFELVRKDLDAKGVQY